jgi:hypothetical protein
MSRRSPKGCDSIPLQLGASRRNKEDHERGGRQRQHNSVVKVVAYGSRTGSYGQRNYSDRDANDGNQISDERCSQRFQRLFQDCCGTPTQRHGTERLQQHLQEQS